MKFSADEAKYSADEAKYSAGDAAENQDSAAKAKAKAAAYARLAEDPRNSAENTVCFTGHRMLSLQERNCLRDRLKAEIERLYSRGYRTFLSGGAMGFDTLAAQEVLRLRESLPGLRLKMILPCRGQSSRWPAADRKEYDRILSEADEAVFLSEEYYSGCMQMRNRFLVTHSSHCVCYLKDRKGGTLYTVACASREGLGITNLAFPGA